MTQCTVKAARTRIRVARVSIGRMDPAFLRRKTITVYSRGRRWGGKTGR